MADEVQDAATKDIEAWTSTMRNVQMDFRPGSAQERIAIELIRIRYEMTEIRNLLKSRKKIVDGGEF
jgi:hypothetical protein